MHILTFNYQHHDIRMAYTIYDMHKINIRIAFNGSLLIYEWRIFIIRKAYIYYTIGVYIAAIFGGKMKNTGYYHMGCLFHNIINPRCFQIFFYLQQVRWGLPNTLESD